MKAQNTNAQLLALINSNVPSGNPNVLTAASLRAVLDAMVNSTNVAGAAGCPTTALTTYQPWANTASAPSGVALSVFDGTNCVPWALLNTTTHQLSFIGSAAPTNRRNIAERFGSMVIWQRGSGSTASIAVGASTTAYTVDGCYLATGTNEASTVAAVAGLTSNSLLSAAITRNSGQTGTGQVTFGCPLAAEEIDEANGGFVTLSFYVKAGANWSPVSGAVTANVLCGLGSPIKQVSGYTNQSTVASTSNNLTLGGAAVRFQVTSSAIVPTNCTQMEVQWTWSPTGTAGAADTITIDSVQLEVAASAGDTASPFIEIGFDRSLMLAKRHFQKTFPYGTAPAQSAGLAGSLFAVQPTNTQGVYYDWRYPVQMRISPNVTTYNPSAGNANCRDVTGTVDLAVTSDPNTAASADHIPLLCAAGTAAGHNVYIHATADAGI